MLTSTPIVTVKNDHNDLFTNYTTKELKALLAEQERQEKELSPQAKQDRLMHSFFEGRLKWHVLTNEILLDGEARSSESIDNLFARQNPTHSIVRPCFKNLLVEIAQENPYNPVLDYLTQVERNTEVNQEVWDKLYAALGLKNELDKTYVRLFCIGAVARALNPGCKVDTALILKGEQGRGKTTFFQTLFSQDFFTTAGEQPSERDDLMCFQQAWCVEYGEFETVSSKKGVSQLKAFMSKQVDLYRQPYAEKAFKHPRRFVLCGSTNQDDFLNDPTGSRRFWVLEVKNDIDLDTVKEIRDSVWASALALYRAGTQWWLSDDEQAQSDVANKEYVYEDAITPVVVGWLRKNKVTQTTTAEVLTLALGYEVSRIGKQEEMRVAALLKKLGYTRKKKKLNGAAVWMFVLEGTQEEVPQQQVEPSHIEYEF